MTVEHTTEHVITIKLTDVEHTQLCIELRNAYRGSNEAEMIRMLYIAVHGDAKR